MSRFEIGDEVGVPCTLAEGAFPDEYLVTIEFDRGGISGFVSRDDVHKTELGHGIVRAVVQDVGEETITLKVYGSYLTTTGLTNLDRTWAASNLQSLSAA